MMGMPVKGVEEYATSIFSPSIGNSVAPVSPVVIRSTASVLPSRRAVLEEAAEIYELYTIALTKIRILSVVFLNILPFRLRFIPRPARESTCFPISFLSQNGLPKWR